MMFISQATNTQTAVKVIAGLIIAGVLVSGLIFWVISQRQTVSSTDSGVFIEETVNPEQILQAETDYRVEVAALVQSYLDQVTANQSDLAAQTKNIHDQLVNWRVPGNFRDVHLALVVTLSEIETAANAAELATIEQKFTALKDQLAKLQS